MSAGDRLRLLMVCEPDALAGVAEFYRDVLGFEIEHDSGSVIGVRDGPTRLLLAAAGGVPHVPTEPTRGAVIVLATQDVEGARRGLGARHDGPVGPIVESGGGARHFELRDPAGHRVWIMQIAPEAG